MKVKLRFFSLFVPIAAIVFAVPFQISAQETVVKKVDVDATTKPLPRDDRDFTKYGSLEYDTAVNAAPNSERWFASQRYDNIGGVYSSVANSPHIGGTNRITHDPIAPSYPIKESSIIMTGQVVSVKAYLSNDRRGVYTEFTINPDEILNDSDNLGQKTIRADREGGVVIYPNGQRIMYVNSNLGLPWLNGRYVFFLAKDGESPNYLILASYDLGGKKIRRLEEASTGPAPEQPEQTGKALFLEFVRTKIAQSR